MTTDNTRFNATKHALRSESLFELNYGEEIEKHYLEHCEFLRPQNAIEEGLVRDLASLRTRIDISRIKQKDYYAIRRIGAITVSLGQKTDTDKTVDIVQEVLEEDKLPPTSVDFPNDTVELFLRYESEARNQYFKTLRFYHEFQSLKIRLGK